MLKKVVNDLTERERKKKIQSNDPFISQFDATKDVKGAFFVRELEDEIHDFLR